MKLGKFFLAGIFTLFFTISAFCQPYYAAGIYSVSIQNNQLHFTSGSEEFIMTKCVADSCIKFTLLGVSTDSLYSCSIDDRVSCSLDSVLLSNASYFYAIKIENLRTPNRYFYKIGYPGTIEYNVGKELFNAWDDLHK